MAILNRTPRYACVAVAILTMSAGIAAELPRHQSKVVVLRNGNVLSGVVRTENQRLVIAKGDDRVTRVALNDVDFVCKDMHEAYRRKLSRLAADNLHQHLRLAQWCLRYEYVDGAADRLLHLNRIAPKNAAVRALEKRMLRRASQTAATVAVSSKKRPVDATREELDDLPPGALPQFTRVVQPLLLNRCGQTACHGGATQSSFQISRGVRGTPNRDLTWKNLSRAIAHIDKDSFAESLLLLKARSVHGNSTRAPIEAHEVRQFEHLYHWVRSIAAPSSSSDDGKPTEEPEPIDVFDFARAPMRQPAARQPAADALKQLYRDTELDTQTSPPAASDPFNPDEFNTRYADRPEVVPDGDGTSGDTASEDQE